MLHYAVIVGETLKAWELACVRELETSGTAHLRCAVVGVPTPRSDRLALPYERYCAQADVAPQRALPATELEAWADSALRVNGYGAGIEWQWRLDDMDLDFVLIFGDVRVGGVFETARYGAWKFVHGDPARFTSSVPGFWELYHHFDVTAASLVKITSEHNAVITLKSGYLPTVETSFQRNVDAICTAMSKWPAIVCRNITDGVAEYFGDAAQPLPRSHLAWPSAFEVLAVRLNERVVRTGEYLRSRLFSIDWNVGIVEQSPSDFIGRNVRPKAKYLFPARKYTFLADPCVVRYGEQTYIFCEQYDHRIWRGLLVQSQLSGKKATPPRVAIEEPYHLSYPHVFEYDGALYCIPESGLANKVDLYRWADGSQTWERVQTLIDGFDGADSTIVRAGGKWWLFCTSAQLVARGYNSHLYLWYADDLFGPWTQHVANPVKIDARSARCAGNFFSHEGRLYRPAQDCSGSYGSCIQITRIDALNEREFKETIVGTIRPPLGKYGKGIHTISSAGDVCVVDARRYSFSAWRIGVALRFLVKRVRASLASVPSAAIVENAAPLPTALDSSPGLK